MRTASCMDTPIIDLRVFKTQGFRVGILCATLNFCIALSTMYVLPQFYQNSLLLAVAFTGWLLLPGGIVNTVVSALAGSIYDHRRAGAGPAGLRAVVPGLDPDDVRHAQHADCLRDDLPHYPDDRRAPGHVAVPDARAGKPAITCPLTAPSRQHHAAGVRRRVHRAGHLLCGKRPPVLTGDRRHRHGHGLCPGLPLVFVFSLPSWPQLRYCWPPA